MTASACRDRASGRRRDAWWGGAANPWTGLLEGAVTPPWALHSSSLKNDLRSDLFPAPLRSHVSPLRGGPSGRLRRSWPTSGPGRWRTLGGRRPSSSESEEPLGPPVCSPLERMVSMQALIMRRICTGYRCVVFTGSWPTSGPERWRTLGGRRRNSPWDRRCAHRSSAWFP